MSVNALATMSDDAFNLQSMTQAVRYNREITRLIQTRAGDGSVLDFGAGRGTFANSFTRSISCIEPEPRLSKDINWQHNIYHRLIDADEQFDFIYSINVLEHIEDDTSVIHGLSQHLKPGGRLFLLLPAREEIYTEMDRYVGHYRRYDISSLRSKLAAAGLSVTSWSYFDVLGYCSTWTMNYAGKIFGWKGSLSPSSVAIYDSAIFPVSNWLDRVGFRHVIGKNILVDTSRTNNTETGSKATTIEGQR